MNAKRQPTANVTRRVFLKGLCATTLTSVLPRFAVAGSADKRPNIVIVLTDDQGFGDLSLHGNVNLKTPNVDSLARAGARFDRFFVCPVCAPTRAEFLTGRYHSRGGVRGVSTGAERLNVDETTIADTFKAAGYATAAFGKWHNGSQYPYHPNGRGFDEYYGFTSGHWGHYFDPMLEHNGQIVRGKGYITDDLTNHAMAFIEQNKSRPFFCYLPFNVPHSPMHVPDSFYEKFADAEPRMRNRDPEKENMLMTRAALAMCENVDYNVGRLLKKLDDLKLADDTVVVFFTDNGPNSWRWNDGMKGRKGSTDEGGVRVPCMIRWPGRIKSGSTIPQIAGAIDLLPTLADLAGIDLISKKPLDGLSLKTLLLGSTDKWPDRMIFSHQRGRVSVRTQRYRLDHTGKLFDMQADPGQYKDISKDKPRIAAKLAAAVKRWSAEALPKGKDDRPFLVGYREFPTTMLPARDGIAHGNVKRSAGAPNCSYFTNFRDASDSITWDIEVATAGKYEAVIYYTCPAEDVGSTIELGFAGAAIKGKVAEAHDPPLRGAESDRAPRGSESYVKDFRPLSLGRVTLPKTRGRLTLRALEVPGRSVMDVRLIVLTLVE